jgi:hypothetical protein
LKPKIAQEVKEEILGKVKAGESVMSLSKSYGVSDKTIYAWLRGKALSNISFMEYARIKKENQQLKEIIGVLTFELSKVKKKTIN